jgi:hypothetical protein
VRGSPRCSALRSHRQRGSQVLAEHQQINQLLHEEYLLPEGEEPGSHGSRSCRCRCSVRIAVALVLGSPTFRTTSVRRVDAYVAASTRMPPPVGGRSGHRNVLHGARRRQASVLQQLVPDGGDRVGILNVSPVMCGRGWSDRNEHWEQVERAVEQHTELGARWISRGNGDDRIRS